MNFKIELKHHHSELLRLQTFVSYKYITVLENGL